MVDDGLNGVLDVIGLFGAVGYQVGQLGREPVRVVGRRNRGRAVGRALGQEGKQPPGLVEAFVLGVGQEVRHAGLDVVHLGAAQRVEGHRLAGGHLDDLGTGDEHVADAVHHECEVGHRRRVHGAAGAGTEDQRELRDDAARFHVAPEDLGVTG